ncbi:hypothetical protein PENSPDRAFT_375124 [Peniophora sp. CONT]|nr:hypothetical protein PENSPDRAFT_375124 [Peniophora sp. CONT]
MLMNGVRLFDNPNPNRQAILMWVAWKSAYYRVANDSVVTRLGVNTQAGIHRRCAVLGKVQFMRQAEVMAIQTGELR